MKNAGYIISISIVLTLTTYHIMTPIRFIQRGCVVTIHSDFINISIHRFIKAEDYLPLQGESNMPYIEIVPRCRGNRYSIVYSKQIPLGVVRSIDNEIEDALHDLYINVLRREKVPMGYPLPIHVLV